ncbi:MAG: TetR/AcrR family transcriptional regulator [Porticoccaceae bacterium]|jgi:TetR/AcrR family transcriptional regulator|nr:TetR/AcrR family transcriptional regulator [Porticoccaceae bacterium]MBT5578645.1 TetR/AcrR family transcriptional regulator [Porticoccaceae bacterium]MBT7374593.1 TetR/AcrR family transcriptional regulator [Porticoccaceae bacterium]
MSNKTSSADRIREKKKIFLAREQKIIDAALELFLKESIDRVTVSKIAAVAGIGKGTVYKHFLTKNEILARIMLDYERNITNVLAEGIVKAEGGDSGAAAKGYFQARLERPELDRLVQQLEVRLADASDIAEQLEELHATRRSNEESLSTLMTGLIGEGVLEDVPPHFHYLACWALAQGAVELCFNRSWNYRTDTKELMEFITNIGVTMGNRGQYHANARQSKSAKTPKPKK